MGWGEFPAKAAKAPPAKEQIGWGEPPAKAVEQPPAKAAEQPPAKEQMGWGEPPAKAVEEQMGWGEPPAEAAKDAWGANTGPRHSERQHTAGEGHGDEHNEGNSDPGSGHGYSSYAAFEPPAMLTREERLAKIKAAMVKVGNIPSRKALLENANKVRLTARPFLGAVYLTTFYPAVLRHACNTDSEAELTPVAACVALGKHNNVARPHVSDERCCRGMRSVERGVRPSKRRPRREASPSGAKLRAHSSRTTSRAGVTPPLMPLPQATTAGGRSTPEAAGAGTPTTAVVLLLATSPRKVRQSPSIPCARPKHPS